jgi:hypothetical protein
MYKVGQIGGWENENEEDNYFSGHRFIAWIIDKAVSI